MVRFGIGMVHGVKGRGCEVVCYGAGELSELDRLRLCTWTEITPHPTTIPYKTCTIPIPYRTTTWLYYTYLDLNAALLPWHVLRLGFPMVLPLQMQWLISF